MTISFSSLSNQGSKSNYKILYQNWIEKLLRDQIGIIYEVWGLKWTFMITLKSVLIYGIFFLFDLLFFNLFQVNKFDLIVFKFNPKKIHSCIIKV
jgi:hypothetical protein